MASGTVVFCNDCQLRLRIPPNEWWTTCPGQTKGKLCGAINLGPIADGFKYCRFNCGGTRYNRVPSHTTHFECCSRCRITYGICELPIPSGFLRDSATTSIEVRNGQLVHKTFIPRGFDKRCLDELKAANEAHAKAVADLYAVIENKTKDYNQVVAMHQQALCENATILDSHDTQLAQERQVLVADREKAILLNAKQTTASMEEEKKQTRKQREEKRNLEIEVSVLKKHILEKDIVLRTEREEWDKERQEAATARKEIVADVKEVLEKQQNQRREMCQLANEKAELEKKTQEMETQLAENKKSLVEYDAMVHEALNQLAKEKQLKETKNPQEYNQLLADKDRDIGVLTKMVEEQSSTIHNMSSVLSKIVSDGVDLPSKSREKSGSLATGSSVVDGNRKRPLEKEAASVVNKRGKDDSGLRSPNDVTSTSSNPTAAFQTFSLGNLQERYQKLHEQAVIVKEEVTGEE